MKIVTVGLILGLLLTGCVQHTNTTDTIKASTAIASDQSFNFVFRYGVTAKNELDTFAGTYTKDMITSPSITIPLTLTTDELTQVKTKVVELDLFNQTTSTDDIRVVTMPCTSYYLKVQQGSTVQETAWDNCADVLTSDQQAFVDFIIPFIEERPEYQALPEATGGYL